MAVLPVLSAALLLLAQPRAHAAGNNQVINGLGSKDFTKPKNPIPPKQDFGFNSDGSAITAEQADRVLWNQQGIQEYGQADYYREGVQTLSTGVLYLKNQIELIQKLRDPSNPTQDPDPQAKLVQVIGTPFCGSENGEDCAQRYLTYQEPILRKYQAAIGADQGMQGELADGVGVSNGDTKAKNKATWIVKNTLAKGEKPDEKTAPKIKNWDSISAEYDERERLMEAQIQDEGLLYTEASKVLMTKPEPRDFIKYTKIPRDPKDPKKGEHMVPVLKADGTPELDPVAYKEAMKDYDRRMKEKAPDGKSLAESYAIRIGKQGKDMQAFIKNNARQSASAGTQGASGGTQRNTGIRKFVSKDQEGLFMQTQDVVLKETEKEFVSAGRTVAGTRSQNFGKAPSSGSSGAAGGTSKGNAQIDPLKAGKSIDVYYGTGEIQKYVDALVPDNATDSIPKPKQGRNTAGNANAPGSPSSSGGQNGGSQGTGGTNGSQQNSGSDSTH